MVASKSTGLIAAAVSFISFGTSGRVRQTAAGGRLVAGRRRHGPRAHRRARAAPVRRRLAARQVGRAPAGAVAGAGHGRRRRGGHPGPLLRRHPADPGGDRAAHRVPRAAPPGRLHLGGQQANARARRPGRLGARGRRPGARDRARRDPGRGPDRTGGRVRRRHRVRRVLRDRRTPQQRPSAGRARRRRTAAGRTRPGARRGDRPAAVHRDVRRRATVRHDHGLVGAAARRRGRRHGAGLRDRHHRLRDARVAARVVRRAAGGRLRLPVRLAPAGRGAHAAAACSAAC